MMEDCHQFYLSQRSQLVVPNVNTNFQYLQKKFTHNLCGLVRASCSYMCRVCLDEYQLFHCFFTDKSVKLKYASHMAVHNPLTHPLLFLLIRSFLESISYNVYDLLRPFIIKVIHLETLAELCTILKVGKLAVIQFCSAGYSMLSIYKEKIHVFMILMIP